jgi:mono/diheme cytochrome c family protein
MPGLLTRLLSGRNALSRRVSSLSASALLTACLLSFSALQTTASELTEQGRDIAQRLCAACHGLGRADRSPLSVAPAFRRIEPRVDLTKMVDRLQNGLVAGHPEMPIFVLKEQEARALVAYMRSLQVD